MQTLLCLSDCYMGIFCVFIGVCRVQVVCGNRHLVGSAGRMKCVVAGVAGTWGRLLP